MYFSKEDVGKGLMQDFISFLCRYSYESEGDVPLYNDIHVKPDDLGAFLVEWVQVPWSHDYGGEFRYLSEEDIEKLEMVVDEDEADFCE